MKTVFGSGKNIDGLLVPAHPSEYVASPREIDLSLPYGTTVLEIAVGGGHCGAALSTGELVMWGMTSLLGIAGRT